MVISPHVGLRCSFGGYSICGKGDMVYLDISRSKNMNKRSRKMFPRGEGQYFESGICRFLIDRISMDTFLCYFMVQVTMKTGRIYVFW